MNSLMEELKRTGTTEGFKDQMWQFGDFNRFIGVEELRRQERIYLEQGLAMAAEPGTKPQRRSG